MSTFSRPTSDSSRVKKEPLPPKPPRPYNPYHIFFRLERSFILQTATEPQVPHVNEYDQGASQRPLKYRNILLPKDWYVSKAAKRKRKDHKIHGVISFKDLSKSMSQRWDAADSETKAFCTALAQEQKDRYKEELKQYVERYGKDALKEQRKKKKKGEGKIKPTTKVVTARRKMPTKATPRRSLKQNKSIALPPVPSISAISKANSSSKPALSEHGGQDKQEGKSALFEFNLDCDGSKINSSVLSPRLDNDFDDPDAGTIGTIDIETIASVDNLDTEFDFLSPAISTADVAYQDRKSPSIQFNEMMYQGYMPSITHGSSVQSLETLSRQPFLMMKRSGNVNHFATNNIGGINTNIAATTQVLPPTPLIYGSSKTWVATAFRMKLPLDDFARDSFSHPFCTSIWPLTRKLTEVTPIETSLASRLSQSKSIDNGIQYYQKNGNE
mmetsp:Transcript_3713/g.7926  ORF Transcript_3713/g.7926 Transcript_3713/m.7926 type:complete len:442 (-) Transcript_3713:159-1484(-)